MLQNGNLFSARSLNLSDYLILERVSTKVWSVKLFRMSRNPNMFQKNRLQNAVFSSRFKCNSDLRKRNIQKTEIAHQILTQKQRTNESSNNFFGPIVQLFNNSVT